MWNESTKDYIVKQEYDANIVGSQTRPYTQMIHNLTKYVYLTQLY